MTSDVYIDMLISLMEYIEMPDPWGCLNIKMLSYQYKGPHVKD